MRDRVFDQVYERLDQQLAVTLHPQARFDRKRKGLARVLQRRREAVANVRHQFAEQKSLEAAAAAVGIGEIMRMLPVDVAVDHVQLRCGA